MITRLATKLVMTFLALFAFGSAALAAEPISGSWVTEEGDAIVVIKPCGRAFCGTLARFLVTPPDGVNQRDVNNPDKNLRKRRLLGLPILTQFTQEDALWRGRIYDPKSGKSYRSVIRRKSANTIEVRGCIGPFCQAQIWRRAK